MGVILDAIYRFVGLFGIHNLALCIFLFTFVVKMLMLPLTIKQQKFTRLSSKMNPELTKIQEKYKKDEDSMRRQQAETQEVYAKYGTNPMGGCLPLLISLPIMFALYRVIYAIPAYVGEVGEWYGTVADAIINGNATGHADAIAAFISDNGIKVTSNLTTYAVGSAEYRNSLIDILAKFSTANWDAFFQTSSFAGIKGVCEGVVANIIKANNLFGLNILDTPNFKIIWSLIIPVLAVVTQMIQTKLATANQPQPKKNSDSPMANSMQSMNTIMPIMSGVFCLMLPIGVGIYWIASALFTILQTIFINRYLDKVDIDAMIEKNVEKANKRKEKLGVVYDNKMAEVAKKSTKTYDNTAYDNTEYKKNNKRKSGSGSDYQRSTVSYSSSSIAANANLLRSRSDDGKKTIELNASIETKDNKDSAEEGTKE